MPSKPANEPVAQPNEPEEVADGEEFEVEEILEKKIDKKTKKVQYLIKWEGYEELVVFLYYILLGNSVNFLFILL